MKEVIYEDKFVKDSRIIEQNDENKDPLDNPYGALCTLVIAANKILAAQTGAQRELMSYDLLALHRGVTAMENAENDEQLQFSDN